MSTNTATIERYFDGFRRSDHAMILACLTDDVEWVIPGMVHLHGKQAFDGEIENPAFKGSPTLTNTRIVEGDNVVFVEGAVEGMRADDTSFRAVYCDVFDMRDGLIRRLTSYLMQLPT